MPLLGRLQSDLPLGQVSHLASEFGLFPALLASLPDKTTVPGLELLFADNGRFEHWSASHPNDPTGDTCPVSLELATRPQLPNLRKLRLGPCNVESALCTVLSAQDIAALVTSLGCMTPLENVTICRGVHVDDLEGALKCLALSVVLDADPTYWHLYS
ncbi:hypothetical protein AURDEDRAFT_165912 [Auricularia subglabra TFB-10046 SS5]|nr:hypothetical protein AURDEDRAFT_165912 [Auricularia subglabra TFB-10046 SS5]